jgi:hypothetical protein
MSRNVRTTCSRFDGAVNSHLLTIEICKSLSTVSRPPLMPDVGTSAMPQDTSAFQRQTYRRLFHCDHRICDSFRLTLRLCYIYKHRVHTYSKSIMTLSALLADAALNVV